MKKIKKGDYVLVDYYGPLYVIDQFRNGPDALGQRWTEYVGINGLDGVHYQFVMDEVIRPLSREEFDAMPKTAEYAHQFKHS